MTSAGTQARAAFAALALAVLVVHAVVAARIPRQGFVTVDLGALWLQAHAVAASGVPQLPVGPLLEPIAHQHWPWRLSETPPGPVDDFRSFSGAWFVQAGGRWLIIYPIGFAWLCALLLRLAGEWGPAAVGPVSAAIATAATGALAARLGVQRPLWPAVVVGLASPLTLYAVLVWGHAPAVAASAVGWWLLSVGQVGTTAGAGLAFGAAAALRNEGLLLTAAGFVALGACGPRPRWRHGLAYVLGAGLALAGPLAYNHATFGSWLDPTQASRAGIGGGGAAPGALERLAAKAQRAVVTFDECLLRSDNLAPGARRAMALALLAALALCAAGRVRAGALAASAAGGLYLTFALVARPQQVPGLLLCAPALVPGVAALCAPWRWGDARMHALAAALFLLGCAQRGSPGWQWGARYMLPALPVLAVLAARALEGCARSRVSMVTLVALGAGMTVVGWRDLASEQRFREEEQAVVREIGAPVVAFDHWWFSWENAPLALERELMFVSDPPELAALLARLPPGPVRRVALVTRARSADLERYAAAARERGWAVSGRWDAALPFGFEWHALSLDRM